MLHDQETTDTVLSALRLRMEYIALQLQRVRMQPVPSTVADVRSLTSRLLAVAEDAEQAIGEWRTLDARMTTECATPSQWRGMR